MSVFHTQYSTKLPMCQFSKVIDTNNLILYYIHLFSNTKDTKTYNQYLPYL